MKFDIQRHAETGYVFKNPITANVKFPIATNDSGELCEEGETMKGTKNFTIKNIAPTATVDNLWNGTDEDSNNYGIIKALLLLGTNGEGRIDLSSITKTVTYESSWGA